MAEPVNPCEGTIPVDFNKITKMFADFRHIAEKATTPREFVYMVQTVTSQILYQYFEAPDAHLYRTDDRRQIESHVMDCINSITPDHIPYTSVSVNGYWKLIPKDKNSVPSKPN